MKGFSGNPGGDPGRARRELNAATIQGFANAFRRGGQQAIDKIMKEQPAHFVKMLVLLVPRELEVLQSTGVKGMSDEQLERALSAVEALMIQRGLLKQIEGKPLDVVSDVVQTTSN